MPTLSAEACKCGTPLEYRGVNADFLHCTHCDEVCLINARGGDCPLCKDFNEKWRLLMQDIYGPGRAM